MNWLICAPRMKIIHNLKCHRFNCSFPSTNWSETCITSNSTDFSQPLYENKWIKSNNSYLWMCITEYSPPRHDIIVLQRTKLCPNHVRSQYTSTHTPPTTHWQGHTPLQSHCGQWPAALTWPFAQPRLRSVNGGAVFTFFYGFNFYVYFSIRMCCLSCFRKAMMCQKSET